MAAFNLSIQEEELLQEAVFQYKCLYDKTQKGINISRIQNLAFLLLFLLRLLRTNNRLVHIGEIIQTKSRVSLQMCVRVFFPSLFRQLRRVAISTGAFHLHNKDHISPLDANPNLQVDQYRQILKFIEMQNKAFRNDCGNIRV